MNSKVNLVIQTAFLGDLILSIPTLRQIKKVFPESKLAVVCKSGLGDFLIKEKIVDIVYEVKKSDSQSYRDAIKKINTFKILNVFCLHRSVRSQLFASKIKAEHKVGFSSLLGRLIFDDLIDYSPNYPEVIRQFKILETVDKLTAHEFINNNFDILNDVNVDGSLSVVPDFFSFNSNFKKMAQSDAKRVAIFPGSVWATKKWYEEGFIQLVNKLLDNNCSVDLFGGPEEKDLCESLAKASPVVRVFAGKLAITDSIEALKDYNLVISNDSAATHMAAYCGIPVLTLFGPTTVKMGFRPWSNNSYVVENKNLKCRPCGKHGHHRCPLGHHLCMKEISADEVYRTAMKLLCRPG